MKERSSFRPQRIGEAVRRVISRFLLNESAVLGVPLTTAITEVRMSPDLRYAEIYVRFPYSDAAGRKKYLKALKAHEGAVRKIIAQELNLRYAPSPLFKYDTSSDSVARIDRLLHQAVAKISDGNSEV